jgi:hypothetical protein
MIMRNRLRALSRSALLMVAPTSNNAGTDGTMSTAKLYVLVKDGRKQGEEKNLECK